MPSQCPIMTPKCPIMTPNAQYCPQVTILGAHWDTVPDSPGMGDNGSGVSALLEVTNKLALLLKEEKTKQKNIKNN